MSKEPHKVSCQTANCYESLERIGEGNNVGEVYKARDVFTEDVVAVKRVRLRDVDSGGTPSFACWNNHPFVPFGCCSSGKCIL